jgi:hypothetical protein
MPDHVHIGSEVAAGMYRCTNCGFELELGAGKHLPPCPKCSGPQEWEPVSGGAEKVAARQAVPDTSDGSDETSRFAGYDKRLEEWLGSLKDEAGQRSPDVLAGLATKARDVADYLDSLADRARAKVSSASPSSETDAGTDD